MLFRKMRAFLHFRLEIFAPHLFSNIEFLPFFEKYSAELSKLFSTCPEEEFEEKDFFENFIFFFYLGLSDFKCLDKLSGVLIFFPNVNAHGEHRLNVRERKWQTSERREGSQ